MEFERQLHTRLVTLLRLSLLVTIAAGLLIVILGDHLNFWGCVGFVIGVASIPQKLTKPWSWVVAALMFRYPILLRMFGVLCMLVVALQIVCAILLLISPKFWEYRHNNPEKPLQYIPDLYGYFQSSFEG